MCCYVFADPFKDLKFLEFWEFVYCVNLMNLAQKGAIYSRTIKENGILKRA